jgi:hypothetical protein
MTAVYKLTEDVPVWLGDEKTLKAGTMVKRYEGCTYGCISDDGIAVYVNRTTRDPQSGNIKYEQSPFFEVPRRSVEHICDV